MASPGPDVPSFGEGLKVPWLAVLVHPLVLVRVLIARPISVGTHDMRLASVTRDDLKDLDESVIVVSILAEVGFALALAGYGALGGPMPTFGGVTLLAVPLLVWGGHLAGWYVGELATGRGAARARRVRPSAVLVHGTIGWTVAVLLLAFA